MLIEQTQLLILAASVAITLLLSLLLCRWWWHQQRRQMDAEQQHRAAQIYSEQQLRLQIVTQSLEEAQRQLHELRQREEKLQLSFNQTQLNYHQSASDLAVAQQQLKVNERLHGQLLQEQSTANKLREENASLRVELEQQELRMREQLALLNESRQALVKEFENTANKIFEEKHQRFSSQSKESLEATLNPLRQQLGEFRKRVDDVYSQETADRNKLVGQISELQKQTQKIGQDAVNLAKALKGDNKAQGNWGEVILERLLEESGLQKGREYETQVSLKTEAGERRNPDVLVRLPEGKDIIIDAKVSLRDYERFCSAQDDDEKRLALKAHIHSLRSHINGLSIKDYEKLELVRSLDFVFIFVPIEAAFMLALQEDPGLFREAYDKHIILVSPTTLLATLRTVESIWRYEKQNRNAEKIAAQAGGLYDQFTLLIESFEEVGKAINRSQDAFEKAKSRLSAGRGNLIKRVEDIRKLGAKTKKTLKGPLVDNALDHADVVGDDRGKLALNADIGFECEGESLDEEVTQ